MIPPFLRHAVRRLLHWLLPATLLMLAGCEYPELYPSGATQIITVGTDGEVTMSYTGTFRDTFDVLDGFLKEVGRRDPERVHGAPNFTRADVVRGLRKTLDGAGARFRIGSDDTVRIERFESDDPDGWPSTITYLGKVFRHGEIVEIIGDHEVEEAASQAAEAGAAAGQADPGEAFFGTLIADKVGPHFRGTLIVRTRGLVREHNADETGEGRDGYTEYLWRLGFPPRQPQMVIDTREYSEAQRKLLMASPGTSCHDLISEQCSCGPFQLLTPGGREPVANARYRITTDEQTSEGCTDASGLAPAIRLDRVSRQCDLQVWPDEPCRAPGP